MLEVEIEHLQHYFNEKKNLKLSKIENTPGEKNNANDNDAPEAANDQNANVPHRAGRRNNHRTDPLPVSDSRNFVGEIVELGAVIGLLSERLDKGVTLE